MTGMRLLAIRVAALFAWVLAATAALDAECLAGDGAAQTPEERVEALEHEMKALAEEIRTLKAGQQESARRQGETEAQVEGLEKSFDLAGGAQDNRLHLGGYGEIHANFSEDSDVFDIHRLVVYLGYDFADWVRLNSEIELEHAFVSGDSSGEISLEQAYVDFLLSQALNFRAGRVLTPLGIINRKHEPTLFNGVERPSFDKYIIPTTWSSDGLGVFGSSAPWTSYELYVVGGLDGSQFGAKNGIRDGRIKEISSLNDPAVTGRIDFYPLVARQSESESSLRVGLSSYYGGLDNGNNGNDPAVGGSLLINSADFESSVKRFDFRGAVAHEEIAGAREIGNGTAEEIFGWCIEAACHFMPERWKAGRLKKADAVVFVRYDTFDTQYKMPSGVPRNPAFDRNEWTTGVTFYPTSNFVVKGDCQFRDNGAGDRETAFNVGMGWQF